MGGSFFTCWIIKKNKIKNILSFTDYVSFPIYLKQLLGDQIKTVTMQNSSRAYPIKRIKYINKHDIYFSWSELNNKEKSTLNKKTKIHKFGSLRMHLVINEDIRLALQNNYVPPIGEYDPELEVTWFVPREVIPKKTKNGAIYWIVNVTDSTGSLTKIKCWGVKPEKDKIFLNKPYMAKLDYNEQWGFSTRSIKYNFKLLG